MSRRRPHLFHRTGDVIVLVASIHGRVSDVSNSGAVVQTLNSLSSKFEPPKLVLQPLPASVFQTVSVEGSLGPFRQVEIRAGKKAVGKYRQPSTKANEAPT